MYGQSAKDHGTLKYFQSLLNCNTVKADVKAVDTNLEFVLTVFKGHILSCACQILEINTLDGKVHLPPSLLTTAVSICAKDSFCSTEITVTTVL